jgi:ATP-dependent RNA helicase RhlE
VPEDYVHRIGRTGRAGASGEAISLVCVDELGFLRDIERLIKRSIEREVIAGFEPDPAAVAQPVFAQRGRKEVRGASSSAQRGQPGAGRGWAAKGPAGDARGRGHAHSTGAARHRDRASPAGQRRGPASVSRNRSQSSGR